MPIKTIVSYALFGGAFLTNKRTVGSVIPSSPLLAKKMAEFVPANPAGLVVELGAGTGVITEALLKRGIPSEKLIAVDCSAEMVEWTRKRFPGLKVLLGDAARLSELLGQYCDLKQTPVTHIVSSLPLRSLPKEVVEGIAHEVKLLLGENGQMIQFTYDLRTQAHPALAELEISRSKVVWFNFPPARVNVYHNGV